MARNGLALNRFWPSQQKLTKDISLNNPGGISNHADDIEPLMAHGATKCAIWLKDLEMYLKEML